jgi:hypothetical protein
LFKCDINPKIRNANKCTPLEVATSIEDNELVTLIFEFLLKRREKKIERNKRRIQKVMSLIPDFYLEMFWEVNIPLVKYFCPNDTCKIWKYQQNVRMDYSFLHFKNLSTVRCPSTHLFIENNNVRNFYQLNHKTHTYFNPFDSFDEEEKSLIIQDILNSRRIDGEFKLKKCSVSESKSYWYKKPIIEKVNGFTAQKYEINVCAMVNIHNKEKVIYQNLNKENYFNQNIELEQKTLVIMDKDKFKNHLANGLKVKNDALRGELMKIDQNKEKSLKAYVWIAENFPIKSSV